MSKINRGPSLTIVITAYNEEKILPRTFNTTIKALEGVISDYEILIIDDKSRDGTHKVVEELALHDHHTRAIYNEKNLNQGGCYKKGIALATKEYYILLPGDDMVSFESLHKLFRSTGQADMSLITLANYEVRHPLRRLISQSFVGSLNILFGLDLKYYNGPVIVKTSLLKNMPITGSFAFVPESIIPLLVRGYSYVIVPMIFTKDERGANMRAIRRNLWPVVKSMCQLFWRVRVRRA